MAFELMSRMMKTYMGWGWRVGDGDAMPATIDWNMKRGGRAWRCSKKREGELVHRALEFRDQHVGWLELVQI